MKAEASLKIKSYFSASVEQAVQEARKELGAEAVLITSRRAAPEASHRGAYEVVFGISGEEPETPPEFTDHDLSREVARLRDQLENIKRALQPESAAASSGVQRTQLALASAGLDDTLIQAIIGGVECGLPSPSLAADFEKAAVESLGKRLRFAPEFNAGTPGSRRSIVLVGPPGAGKTTTLAKVAMQECLGRKLAVRIISVETHRVAAHEKLRSLARIMGFGFTEANSMQELIEAASEFRGKDVLLIDTPGFSRDDFDAAGDLIRFLNQMTPREIHLVLPASMNRDDLMLCYQRYAGFQPDYLLFTKLDETESRGGAISVALEADKPISFLTKGQSIPEDIELANVQALLGKLIRREQAAVSAA